MHVTRILTREHVLIKQVLHLLDRSRQALEAGDPVPVLLPGRYCCMSAGQHETRDALPGSHMNIGAATHIGQHRKTNQDRYLACLENQSCTQGRDFALLALADGMGTTLICAVVSDNTVFWAHSGDSRLYLLHGHHLTLITRDQTLADFLVSEKEITPNQARTHYSRQVLEQYIGCGELAPQSGRFELAGNDMILLMSDGCYRAVSPDTIVRECRRSSDAALAAAGLVKQALAEDGSDNITVVVKATQPFFLAEKQI